MATRTKLLFSLMFAAFGEGWAALTRWKHKPWPQLQSLSLEESANADADEFIQMLPRRSGRMIDGEWVLRGVYQDVWEAVRKYKSSEISAREYWDSTNRWFQIQLDEEELDNIHLVAKKYQAGEMSALTELMQAMMEALADPRFQKEAKRFAQPLMKMMDDPRLKMMDDPRLHEEAKRVAEQIAEVIGDPAFQEEAQRIAEPLMAKMDSPEAMLENLEALREDPNVKELAEQVAAPMREMMSNEDFQEKAKMEEVIKDPTFQKEAKRIAEPLAAIMNEAKQMQEVMADPSFQDEAMRRGQQMQALLEEQQAIARTTPQKKSLAALLLAGKPLC